MTAFSDSKATYSRVMRVRQVRPEDLDACAAIEAACYGPEGATRERIEKRIRVFPQGFLVGELEGRIFGFINSGATSKDDITDEAFKDLVGHEPDGANLVIFSLAIHPQQQKQGLSRPLMEAFIETARRQGKRKILLLCREHLLGYYAKYGFAHVGESRSTHGGLRWHEMELALAAQAKEARS